MTKGWFRTKGRDGDRTLDEQMIGLEPLSTEIRGKRVLDFGCAEGLIGMELINRGATGVTGIDSVEDHIKVGKAIATDEGIDIRLVVGNLNDYPVETLEPVDVVLLLAILHKLRNPSAFAARAAALAKEQVVVRLPPSGAVIRDERSGFVPQDIGAVLATAGFALTAEMRGTNDEWIGYYRRPSAPVVVDAPPKVEPPAEPPPIVEPVAEPPAEPVAVAEVPIEAPAEAAVMTTAQTETAPEPATSTDAPIEEADEKADEVSPMTTETAPGRRRGKRTGE